MADEFAMKAGWFSIYKSCTKNYKFDEIIILLLSSIIMDVKLLTPHHEANVKSQRRTRSALASLPDHTTAHAILPNHKQLVSSPWLARWFTDSPIALCFSNWRIHQWTFTSRHSPARPQVLRHRRYQCTLHRLHVGTPLPTWREARLPAPFALNWGTNV